MTIREAAEKFVGEMNCYPRDMVEVLSQHGGEWEEVTMPSIGDRVYVNDMREDYDTDENSGEIIGILHASESTEKGFYEIKLDDGTIVNAPAGAFEVEYDDWLPMWGWMWSFKDDIDDEWLEDHNGIQLMSECGFRIYHSESWGYFFGIDGGGYSFYDEHWIPLYRARGLHWHNED